MDATSQDVFAIWGGEAKCFDGNGDVEDKTSLVDDTSTDSSRSRFARTSRNNADANIEKLCPPGALGLKYEYVTV